MYAKIYQVALHLCKFEAINRVLIVFQLFTPNFSSNFIVKMKLKNLINYKERNEYQTTIIYKIF